MKQPVRDLALGKWRGILETLGIDRSFLTGKHTACPICRNGKDRFRWDNREGAGTWICSACGAGDGFLLLMKVHGWEFKQAAEEVERIVGNVPVEVVQRRRTSQENRDAMNRMWREAVPVEHGDAVGRYLRARGIEVKEFPSCLRYAHKIRYADDGSWHPAMLAMVTDVGGRAVNLHRTYIGHDGRKAEVEKPRMMMPGSLPKGAAVRLFTCRKTLGIAEGIETALSAAILFNLPVWAAVNATMLAAWEPPQDVERVVVFGDNDPSFTGQAAAYGLAQKLRARGLEVKAELSPVMGEDWNDILRSSTPTHTDALSA